MRCTRGLPVIALMAARAVNCVPSRPSNWPGATVQWQSARAELGLPMQALVPDFYHAKVGRRAATCEATFRGWRVRYVLIWKVPNPIGRARRALPL